MIKRITIITVILAIVGGGVGWYLWDQKVQPPVSNPLQAIPEDASLILRFVDFKTAFNHFDRTDYSQQLALLGHMGRLAQLSSRLDSVLSSNSQLAATIGFEPWYVSYHYPDQKQAVSFYAHKMEQEPTTDDLKDFFISLFGSDATFSEHVLQEQTVYKAVFEDPFELTQFCIVNGILIVCESQEVLEKAITQLQRKSGLTEDASFQKLLTVDGENVDMNMYVPFSNIDDILRPYLKSTSLDILNSFGMMAEWAQLDVNFKEDGVMLNGFTFMPDSGTVLLNLLNGQEPLPMDLTSALPSNTAFALYAGLSNISEFQKMYKANMLANGSLDRYNNSIDSLNKALDIDVESILFSWIGTGFGVCITKPNTSAYTDQTFLIVNTNNADAARSSLFKLDNARLNSEEIEPALSVNDVDIYETDIGNILHLLFSETFTDTGLSHYMILDDHVIFGHSISALRSYQRYLNADKELAKDLAYSVFAEHMGASSNLFIYSRIRAAMPILDNHLSYHTQGKIEERGRGIEEFGSIGIQLSNNQNSLYTNLYLSYEPQQEDVISGEQMATLDTTPAFGPVFVTNHYNGEPEVLVQDVNDKIYLFNKNGKEIWNRKIEGQIKSRIHQVDAFKNRKIQFLFNTEDHIYLVDRKGNDVEGFPIKLKAKALTPVCVANYDNKRNYRLVITCANNRIYNYRINGKATSGWKHNKSSDPTTKGFHHFSVGGKDFYVTAESNGKVHLLDRRGKNRVRVNSRIKNLSQQPLQVFVGKTQTNSAVYATDTLGTLYRISLKGKVTSTKLANMSPGHTFLVSDLDNDGLPEFIFNDLNMLTVYDHEYNKTKEHRLSPGTKGPFELKLSNGNTAIGLYNKDEAEIVMLNKELQAYPEFPMNGYSKFDLRDDMENGPTMITTRGEGSEIWIIALQ